LNNNFKKISFLIEELNTSGGIKILTEIINTFADNNYIATLYVMNYSQQFYSINQSIKIIYLSNTKRKFNFFNIYKTICVIRKIKDPIFLTNFRVALLCAIFKRKSIKSKTFFLIQGLDRISLIRNSKSNILLKNLNYVLYYFSTLITADRIFVSNYLKKIYDKSGVVISNYCSDIFYDNTSFNDYSNNVVIGIVSTSSPNKRFKLFNDIITELNTNIEYRNFNYVFKCATQDEKLLKGFDNNIIFENPKNEKEMSNFYNSCNLVLSLSISEGFNLPIIEAMASGRVVISTNDGASNDLIDNEYNGIILNTDKPHSFANQIFILLNNKLLFNKISQNAIISSKKYSIHKFRNSYLNLLT
jgi:glycosyltransferase involved in cell wall biosynthesis